ncbi:MAG: ornithine cyclodeaminase family protein [Alphaproteobacteria bacterium]|nr:MAG: ornithine cyclodeaminase family protein [Alphaproteobacteria bacterium]
MTEVRILGSAEVRQLLSMTDCIEVIDKVLRTTARRRLMNPLRTVLALPGETPGFLGYMPGWLADPAVFGAKLISVFPGNHGRGLSSHQGVVVIFEIETGQPVAILDASAVTAIRTAAASAVATRALARRDASVLAVLGYGEQAREHVAAMAAVRPVRRVVIWGRSAEKARDFAKAHAALAPEARFEVAESVAEAVAGADLICTTTAAKQPILKGEWVKPGCHVNAVGASQPNVAEVDGTLVARSRYYVDFIPSAEAEAAQYRNALAAGLIGQDHILGEVGAVLDGEVPGRQSDDDITFFESLGFAAEDLATAHFVFERAATQNVGVTVRF